jgi:hypothetical protein
MTISILLCWVLNYIYMLRVTLLNVVTLCFIMLSDYGVMLSWHDDTL